MDRGDAWTAAWRQTGMAGFQEGAHGGAKPKRGPDREARRSRLLADTPHVHGHQATGWTVPLLQTELAQVGYAVGECTINRLKQHRALATRYKQLETTYHALLTVAAIRLWLPV